MMCSSTESKEDIQRRVQVASISVDSKQCRQSLLVQTANSTDCAGSKEAQNIQAASSAGSKLYRQQTVETVYSTDNKFYRS